MLFRSYRSLLPVTYPPPCIQNITGFLFVGSTPPGTEISRYKQSSVPIAAPVKCSKRMREMSTKFIEAHAYTYNIRGVLDIKPNLVSESTTTVYFGINDHRTFYISVYNLGEIW